jgi:molecular chaperone GrpE
MRIPIQMEPEGEPTLNGTEAETSEEKEQSFEETAYLRLKADFENLKKRREREIEEGMTREVGSFYKSFLPIYDDLERAITCSAGNGSPEDFKKGISLICKRIREVLREQGVERIDAVAKPFDPQKHEAIMVQDNSELPSNTVIEELQPGYLFKNTLLRPSKVKVAK